MITPRLDSAPRFRSLKGSRSSRRWHHRSQPSPHRPRHRRRARGLRRHAGARRQRPGRHDRPGHERHLELGRPARHREPPWPLGLLLLPAWSTGGNYDNRTDAQSLPASSSTQAAAATLSGLNASTQYHFRLVAVDSRGNQSRGTDLDVHHPGCGRHPGPDRPGAARQDRRHRDQHHAVLERELRRPRRDRLRGAAGRHRRQDRQRHERDRRRPRLGHGLHLHRPGVRRRGQPLGGVQPAQREHADPAAAAAGADRPGRHHRPGARTSARPARRCTAPRT